MNSIIVNQGTKDFFGKELKDEEKLVSLKNKLREFFNLKNVNFLFGSGVSNGVICTMAGLYESLKFTEEEALKKKVWDALFIHIFPQSSSTEIIIGYHNNHTSRDMEDYVKLWNGLGRDEIGYKLTDLFVAHVEDWGLSPRLFEKIPEERFRKFFELQAKYSTVVAEQKTNVGYNLFEGLL